MSLLALPLAGLAGWLAALVLTPFAYRKVLAARDVPWTERARLAWPARKWAGLALVAIPAVLGALVSHLGGPLALLGRPAAGLLGGAAALAGYTLGMWPTARRLHGNEAGGAGRFFASSVAVLCVRAPHIVVAAAVAAFMPPRFTGHAVEAAVLLVLGTVLVFAAALGGGLAAGRFVGLIRPADERLRRAVGLAASRAGVPQPAAFVMECALPAAFAIPIRGILVFSDSALALFDEAELEAVASHETAHLTEPRSVTLQRLAGLLFFAFLVAVPSLAGEGGRTAFLAVLSSLVALAAAGVFSRRTSVEMERRADAHAAAHAEQSVYARSLEKLHEAALVPAVLGRRLATHPDLWDRMAAAGAQPSWPKPLPPARGGVGRFALLLGCALAFVGAEAGFTRALPAIVRSSPVAAVALTGGDAWPVSELARARAAGGRPEDAVAFYRAAFSLDGRPGHLANAAFVESRMGRCDAARGLAAEAGRAARVAGTAAWDRHLAARAADVAAHCRAGPAGDDDPDD